MNILFYPSWYQAKQKHNNGIFFRDQAEAISRNCNHNIVFLISNIELKKKKYGIPNLKFQEYKKEGLLFWEYSVFLPAILNRIKIKEYISQLVLRKTIARMKRINGKIDLIHAHSFLKAGFDACILHKKYKIPVVTTEHLSSVARGLSPHAKQNFLYTMRESDKVICVSSFLDSIIKEYIPDECKSVVIPNLINKNFAYDAKIRKNTTFTFLYVGHLIPGKRIKVMIEGFINAFSETEDVQLLLIGDGAERKALEQQVIENNRTHQIKFLGALFHEDVSDQMKKAHAFVHTSQLETFGVVLIEALASGLPVICTKCGGPEDIMTNYGCTSIGVDNIEELTVAMRRVKQEYDEYDLNKISKDAINRFGEEIVANQINQVYESIVLKEGNLK